MRNPKKVASLRKLILRVSPSLGFVSKTRLHGAWARSVKYKVGMENCFVIYCIGWTGGLSLLWRDDWEVSILNFLNGHIDAWVKSIEGMEWRFMGFYRNPTTLERRFPWEFSQENFFG